MKLISVNKLPNIRQRLEKSIPLILDNQGGYISNFLNKVKLWIIPIAVALLIVVNAVVLTRFSDTNQKFVEQQSMTIETKNTLRSVQGEKAKVDTSLKEERLKAENLQTENESLKVSLQAKKDAEAKKIYPVAEVPKVAATVSIISGTKSDWLAASGIPEDQWSYVDSIVTRESGWNPNAINKSSGACGLGQQLPCGKWSGAWNDPVAALIAMNGYVTSRYGSWAGAVAFWNTNHWY